MIFGYNTDVKAGDTVYHVQTEDRGEKNPVIDSTVYVKGRIIDRRRTPYDPGQQTPEQLQVLAKRQHRALVEAIRGGGYQPPASVPRSEEGSPAQAASGGARATPAGQPARPDWGQLGAGDAPPGSHQTCSLELIDVPEIGTGKDLVFRVKITSPFSDQPVSGALLRALLRDEAGEETLQEASASDEGIAEVRFEAPPSGKATVLFQATGPISSDLLRFHVRRATEPL